MIRYLVRMHCPKCAIDINDDQPQCPECGFSIQDLDEALGEPPPQADSVCDWAKVLSEAGTKAVRERLQQFVSRTGHPFILATIPTTSPRLPSEYVFWLFNRWKVGGDDHSGLLILLAIQERRIEVEVGFSLERFVTDEAAANILQFHAVPFLKASDFDGGVFHAVDILARVVEQGEAQEKSQ